MDFNQFNKNYYNFINFLTTIEYLSFDVLILFFQSELNGFYAPLPSMEPTYDYQKIHNFKMDHQGIENFDLLFYFVLRGNLNAAYSIFHTTKNQRELESLKFLNKNLSKNLIMFPNINMSIESLKAVADKKVLTKFELVKSLLNMLYNE